MRALVDGIERAAVLDRPGNRLQSVVTKVLRGRVRDLLHGVWLGHPIHPIVVLVPIGSWLSASLLDVLRINHKAPTALVGAGSAGAVAAAITGLNDWSSLTREQRRTGLVHATVNTIALGLQVASLAARRRGDLRTARWLSYAGLATVGFGGYLGGHLSYRQAASVNQAEPLLRRIPEGWHAVCDLEALTPGRPQVHHIDEVPVLVVRNSNDDVTVMIERCGHETGPLGEGEVRHIDGADCVVCPWHGSTFRLTDGIAVHGPAATTQPLLRSRVRDGLVEAALP
ncbi:MAG: Rieske 2Fe-2S domain-containing protein [Micromonosporaceae bacterium]|nr:Rieske 2Fe-2S domain-containing protein [Micromonosporaceae bacterium]